jgi:hypothetical protein
LREKLEDAERISDKKERIERLSDLKKISDFFAELLSEKTGDGSEAKISDEDSSESSDSEAEEPKSDDPRLNFYKNKHNQKR